eukprot:3935748-Rhodomonas_salina.2
MHDAAAEPTAGKRGVFLALLVRVQGLLTVENFGTGLKGLGSGLHSRPDVMQLSPGTVKRSSLCPSQRRVRMPS